MVAQAQAAVEAVQARAGGAGGIQEVQAVMGQSRQGGEEVADDRCPRPSWDRRPDRGDVGGIGAVRGLGRLFGG